MDERTKQAKEITGKLTDYLNSFSSNQKNADFCEAMSNEHRTLQQNFTSLCLAWIEFMGNDSEDFKRRFTDPRNQFSNQICTQMLEFLKEKGINSNLPCI